MSFGIEQRQFTMSAKPPNIERPRTVEALAPEVRAGSPRGRRSPPQADARGSRSDDSVFHRADDDSRHHVGLHHRARNPPSRPAHADVSPRWRTDVRVFTVQTAKRWPPCEPVLAQRSGSHSVSVVRIITVRGRSGRSGRDGQSRSRPPMPSNKSVSRARPPFTVLIAR